jgi:hypothetical protein
MMPTPSRPWQAWQVATAAGGVPTGFAFAPPEAMVVPERYVAMSSMSWSFMEMACACIVPWLRSPLRYAFSDATMYSGCWPRSFGTWYVG